MIGFKGRLSFIQYMPKNPTKWGMKAFVLADSKSGYTYNFTQVSRKKNYLVLLNQVDGNLASDVSTRCSGRP